MILRLSQEVLRTNFERDTEPIGVSAGVNVITLFSSLLMKRPNKLEYLYLEITFQSSLTFAVAPRAYPRKEASERYSNWVGSGLALKF